MAIPQRAAKPAFLPPIKSAVEPVPDGIVRQHRKVTFSHQKRISVLSKRIMARVLEQIKYGATALCPAYTVGVMDLIKDTNLDPRDVYKYAKAAVDELADVRWNFEDLEKKIYIPRHLLNTSLPEEEASRVNEGLVTIVLNPALAPYFVNLAGSYTTFNVSRYLELSSWYSMRLFEMLASWEDTGVWYVSIEDYRLVMDCGPQLDRLDKPKKDKAGNLLMKYPATKDLIEQTVARSQPDLADTPYAFEYVALLEAKAGTGRRKISHLEFRLLRPKRTVIPAEWLAEEASARLIAGLRKFAISDHNILEYWDVLTPAGLRKLLREWQLKENGPDRINSKVSYCNAALVREGKKRSESRRQAALSKRGRGQQELFGGTEIPEWLALGAGE